MSTDPSSTAKPEKSFLDNVTIVVNLLVVLFGSFSGAYWSNLQRDREITISEVQTLEQFMPYLIGEKGGENPELAKQNAIVAIASLKNLDLALNLAELNPGSGSILALKNIAIASQDHRAIEALEAIGTDQGYLVEVRTALLRISSQEKSDISDKAKGALTRLNKSNNPVALAPPNRVPTPAPTVTSSAYLKPWTIQAGSDTTLDGANFEIEQYRRLNLDPSMQIYKRGNWYVTTIGSFEDSQSAQNNVEDIREKLDREVFVINLNTFCPKAKAKSIPNSEYIDCPE